MESPFCSLHSLCAGFAGIWIGILDERVILQGFWDYGLFFGGGWRAIKKCTDRYGFVGVRFREKNGRVWCNRGKMWAMKRMPFGNKGGGVNVGTRLKSRHSPLRSLKGFCTIAQGCAIALPWEKRILTKDILKGLCNNTAQVTQPLPG
jgi:hypothetical protein